MTASFGRGQAFPSPASLEPIHPADGRRRRAQRSPRTAPNRQARSQLDNLAIGAPLTAAFIGVLLAKGDAVLGDPAAGSAPANGVRPGAGNDVEVTAAGKAGALARLDGSGDAGASVATSTGDAVFDPPAAASEASVPAEASAAGTMPLTTAGTSAEMTAKMASLAGMGGAGGPMAALEGLNLDGGSSGEQGDGADHRIGATINGTAGDDVIHGTPYNDRLFGGPGNDIIYGYEGDDLLDGGPGNDRLYGGPGDDILLGGSGHDRLYGGTGDDRLDGGTGNDRLYGEEGRDWLDGGPGNDLLDGGPGADRMIGGAGDDRLIVGDLNDVALDYERGPGGGGTDTLVVGGDFAASLRAETGIQEATFQFSENLGVALPGGAAGYTQQVAPGIENVELSGSADYDVVAGSGANHIIGNDGDNALYGGNGKDTLEGGAGDDLLSGGSGGDVLEGGAGDDLLEGGAAVDHLYGGDGDDLLDGGTGADMLYGQAGNDAFQIGLHDSAVDTVFDDQGANWVTIEDGAGHLVETAVAGDDLYVVVDKNPVAVVEDYLGNEDALAGIDSGAGLQTIDALMAPNAGHGPALAGTATEPASGVTAHTDLLADYLDGPSLRGTAGADYLVGTSNADWLRGDAGDDRLVGRAGSDVLEGRDGSDILEGGGGSDRYLFRSGESGLDTIRDTDGANHAELKGFAGAKLDAVVVGHDLVVVADYAPLFKVADFVGHEESFAGVQVGNDFIETSDLLN